MDVLGIGAWTAPGAACLVRQGRIVAAAREDRFTRRPDDPEFPRQAIEYCLRAGKIGPSGLTRIVVTGQLLYREPQGRGRTLLGRLFGRGPAASPAERLARELDPDVPVETVGAPLAHARAAFRMSGFFDETAILVLDGERAAIARGRREGTEILEEDVPAGDAPALLARARELTGCASLAVGGKGAAAGAIVRRVVRAGTFDRLWFQPAGAAAAAVGAALAPGDDVPAGRALGPAYNAHQIRTFLRSRDAEPSELPRDDAAAAVAPLLEGARRVGWFSGRMEFGEQAPASRSVLAAPPDTSDGSASPETVLAVPAERAASLFALDERVVSPFVPAGNTDDGPTVFRADREEHRALHALLEAMEAAGRPPVLECRPLAAPGEALACTPRDAFEAAERGHLDALVMERYVVRPRP